MKRYDTGLLISLLVLLSVIGTPVVAARAVSTGSIQRISAGSIQATSTSSVQATGDVPLQIQLRYSDGLAVSDEPILLQRLPDLQEMACTTDHNGRCIWTVERGLYQVIFSQSLDSISSLAVAEGGLDGFGLTVGDTPITYHFTFHHDAHVYFDAAPEAAVPDPIIPTGDSLHGGIMPTAVSTTVAIAAVTPPSEDGAPSQAMPLAHDEAATTATLAGDDHPANPFWRLLLVVILGLALGGGLHLWSRRRQLVAEQMAEQSAMEQRLTTFVDSPQTLVASPQTRGVSAAPHSSVPTGGSEC